MKSPRSADRPIRRTSAGRTASMRRAALIALVATAGMAGTAPDASADWHSFWYKVRHGFHRNNAWPDPFNQADAVSVVAPFETMKANGWRMHNTIGHDHFRDGDGVLLGSGVHQLNWIATRCPDSRRNVYVLRGRTEKETEARLASVRESIDGMNLAANQSVGIYLTDQEPGSASGAWAVKINQDWLNGIPAPRLPEQSASGTAGISQAGGGGGAPTGP